MQTAVIRFPASNCDRDAAVALEKVTGRKPLMVWHRETELPAGVGFVVMPGGFSYGDYLRSGAIASRSPIVQDISFDAQRKPKICLPSGTVKGGNLCLTFHKTL